MRNGPGRPVEDESTPAARSPAAKLPPRTTRRWQRRRVGRRPRRPRRHVLHIRFRARQGGPQHHATRTRLGDRAHLQDPQHGRRTHHSRADPPTGDDPGSADVAPVSGTTTVCNPVACGPRVRYRRDRHDSPAGYAASANSHGPRPWHTSRRSGRRPLRTRQNTKTLRELLRQDDGQPYEVSRANGDHQLTRRPLWLRAGCAVPRIVTRTGAHQYLCHHE